MIEINALTVSYGEERVLEQLSLSIPDGKRLALMGPSGCGKTTLLRSIAGLVSPKSGEIRISGKISLVFQEPRLFPWLTAAQNIALVAEKRPDSEIRAMLDSVELSGFAEKYPAELSGGQNQRVSIARALFAPFDILLLDEPFKGLDSRLRQSMLRLVNERAEGKTLIISTHDEHEAAALGAQILEYRQKAFLLRHD